MNLEQIIKNSCERHTFFQLNFFILGKEPTHQAKMKKCVDELKIRKKSVDAMLLEIDELNDKNELLEITETKNEIEKRMKQRRILNNNRQIDNLLESMKSQKEEIDFFLEAFNKLSEKEAMKPWDDMEVQLEYWNAKLTEEINTRLSAGLPIDTETMRTILALPNDLPIKKQITSMISKRVEGKNGR